MHNKYVFRSRISKKKLRELIRLFSLDMEASKIAALTGISRNSINKILLALRKRISELCEQENEFSRGVFECDESYFGARRIRGKRGRGAFGKTIVLGIYERSSKKVYTRIVDNVKSKELLEIIEEKIPPCSRIFTDGFASYDALNRCPCYIHSTVEHGRNEFVRKEVHVNGMENYWGVAKVRLNKFKGLKRSLISLHLKESEFRFNHRRDNLYQLLLTNLRNTPLKLS